MLQLDIDFFKKEIGQLISIHLSLLCCFGRAAGWRTYPCSHWHSMFFLSLFLHQVFCYSIVTFLICGFL